MAAFGNMDGGDDAFGAWVARRLVRENLAAIRVLDLAREHPTALLDQLELTRGLMVVDAVRAPGCPSGQLIDVDWRTEARPHLVHDVPLSSHGLSVANQLELAQRLGLLPSQVRLIGRVAEEAHVGADASEDLPQTVEEAVRLIQAWAARWTDAVLQT